MQSYPVVNLAQPAPVRLDSPREIPLPAPYLGKTFDEFVGVPRLGGDLLRLLGHGVGMWLGLYVGSSPQMPTGARVAGWVLGVGMAAVMVLDGVSIIQRVNGTHDPEVLTVGTAAPPGPIGFDTYDQWWLALGRDAGIPYNPPQA